MPVHDDGDNRHHYCDPFSCEAPFGLLRLIGYVYKYVATYTYIRHPATVLSGLIFFLQALFLAVHDEQKTLAELR